MAIGANALRAGKAVIEVGLLVKPVERQLRALQARMQSIGRSFTSAGSFGVMGGGFAGLRNLLVGTLAGEALLYPVKLAANFELATAQMSVFTGSTESANAAIMDLMKFSAIAAQSPEEMANQMRLLMTRDISAEDSLTFIKSLSVLAAGSRDQFEELVKAFADVRSATRLNGEEMRQFKNTAFNPLTEISKRTGESMAQLKVRMEAGKISFNEVAQALQDTVSKGGRFHGMLQTISGTLMGQFNIAVAQMKMALLPLGEHVLKPITEWFKRLNSVLPRIAEQFKKHAAWYAAVLQAAGATALSATAFVAIGLGATVASIALGGFAALLSMLSTLVVTILPIVGLLYLALRGLGYSLGDVVNGAKGVVGGLLGKLQTIYGAIKEVFLGIANAVAAGDLKLATDILWKSLTALWALGAEKLHQIWVSVKYGFLEVMLGITTSLKEYWINFITWFQEATIRAVSLIRADLYGLFHPSATPEQLAAYAAGDSIERITRLELNKKNKLAEIRGGAATGKAAIAAARLAEMLLGGGDARKAVDDLNIALKQARDLWDQQKDGKIGDFGIGGGFTKIAEGLGAVAKNTFKQPEATLDPRHVAESLAGRVQNEQLEQLRAINRNTRRGGGLPVV